MSILMIFNGPPYDGSDKTWNALRLAKRLVSIGEEVRIFLMNDSVDLARDMTKPPEGYFDLVELLKELIAMGATVRVCGTCQARCGIHVGQPYYEGTSKSTIPELADWVLSSDKIISY